MKLAFDPEKVWLDRISRRWEADSERIELSGSYSIPEAELTEAIILRLLETSRGGDKLSAVPMQQRTPTVCLTALRISSTDHRDVPTQVWSAQFIEDALAVMNCPEFLIQSIPHELLAEELCWRLIRWNGYCLESVPDSLKSDQLCLEAITRNGSAIAFAPWHLRTLENFRIAVQSNPYGAMASIQRGEVSPDDYADLWDAAVQRRGLSLENLVEAAPDLVTRERCRMAVQNEPMAINYVPDEHIDRALLELAVSVPFDTGHTGFSAKCATHGPLYVIAKRFPRKVTESLCLLAVSTRGGAIVDVPEEFLTESVMLAAIKQDAVALNWIPLRVCRSVPEIASHWVAQDTSRLGEITDRAVFEYVAAQLPQNDDAERL